MSKIEIKINHSPYSVEERSKILDICQSREIPIATLCQHPDFGRSEAVCRLCLVKVKLGKDKPEALAPACALSATSGMEIITEDAEIARIRRTILELLFVEHAGLCANCYRNLDCELQDLAIKYSIDEFRFLPRVTEIDDTEEQERLRDRLKRKVVDIANPSVSLDSSKCVECRRCVKACKEIQDVRALETQKRGVFLGIGTEYNVPLECTYCGQCVSHCPTAAIIEKNNTSDVIRALKDPQKVVIAQTAPSVRVTIGEEFGYLPGTVTTGKMITSLRQCGFDYVFDVVAGADFTIVEEATELIDRIKTDNKDKPLPQFTSCCPAWVLFCEQYYPQILPHLSSAKSPQLMLGSLIKNYWAGKMKINPAEIVLVSIMPCVAKKYEISRPEFVSRGIKNVDLVLTVRELAHLIKNLNIPFADLAEGKYDPALGATTGSGMIFAASGGVAEAALRTAHSYFSGKSLSDLDFKKVRGAKNLKEVEVRMGGRDIRVAIVQGLKNARKMVEMALRGECPYDFVEVMACPNGCIGGGGQPAPVNTGIRKSRMKAVYLLDKGLAIRESHKNPGVREMYRDFLYGPGSRKAEKLLHTKYYPYEWKLRKEHIRKNK